MSQLVQSANLRLEKKNFFAESTMVCGSLEELPEKSWVARLQSGLAALVAFSGVLMVSFDLFLFSSS